VSTDLVIRPLESDELECVAQGFASAFHVYRAPAEWRRRFAPGVASAMVAHAQGDEMPLAFYGATLHDASWRGQAVQVGHIVDVFSHPDGRQAHPHVFQQTAKAFFDHFCGPGKIQVLYGFPSRGHSRLGERYLDYRNLAAPTWHGCDLAQLRRDMAAVSYAGRVVELSSLDCLGERIRPANADWLHFDMSAAAMVRRFPLGGQAGYRAFALFRTAADELLGIAIVRVIGDTAWLMSLHAAQPALAVGLWTRLVPSLQATGARRAVTMISPAHHLGAVLPELGFVTTDAALAVVPTYRVFDDSLDAIALGHHFSYDLFHMDIL